MKSNDAHQILCLARIYASAKGHALSTVSLRIAGQGSFLGRLEAGVSDITTGRRDRIFQAFSDAWPADTPWPSDIPRPAPSSTDPQEAA